jgi:ribosome biogenesis GTPase A
VVTHEAETMNLNPVHLFYPKDASLDSRPGVGRGKGSAALNTVMSRLQLGNQCVTVVGVIGKSRCGKSKFINTLLDRSLFEVCGVHFVF